jgi:SpoIID/LytB domain protein
LKGDGAGKLLVINDVSVEQYLVSVISSEMSASAHHELLKAHAIISRSWLLAQLAPWKVEREKFPQPREIIEKGDDKKELIRWYDKENHRDFDVCADDHCQRYQGITKALKTIDGALGQEKVRSVIQTTFGRVLTFDDHICDARFSKSCGGMVEQYASAWEDVQIPYLTPLYDGETFPAEFALPLTNEKNAEAWITSAPAAFCNSNDRTILQRILPDFDQETTDFYRWQVTITQTELQSLLHKKLGIEFGAVHSLEPVERGASGRLIKLRITGEKTTLVLGKELEIRRVLSPSHLYSSAFVIRPEFHGGNIPASFTLIGAGWGHGVGLCQIGAALMAEEGYAHENILAHYYPGSSLHKLY